MGMPWAVISLCAAYLYFVLKAGPKLMQNREAFELKTVLSAYNIFQMVINSFIFVMVCTLVDFDDDYDYDLPFVGFDLCASAEQLQTFLHSQSET
jgi:hypothetical protein